MQSIDSAVGFDSWEKRRDRYQLMDELKALTFGSLATGANLQQAIEQSDKNPVVAILLGVTAATGVAIIPATSFPDIYAYMRKYHAESRIVRLLERFRKEWLNYRREPRDYNGF